MKYSKLSIYTMLLLLLLCGCKKDENPSSGNDIVPASDVIVPLAVGNEWTYIDSSFSDTGTFLKVDTSRLVISGKSTHTWQNKSLEFFHWNWYDKSTKQMYPFKWLVRNDEDGFNVYGGISPKNTYLLDRLLWQKFPVVTGDSWRSRDIYYYGDSTFKLTDTVIYNCISTNAAYNTPLGTLNCSEVKKRFIISDSNTESNSYFCKNIGFVGVVYKLNGVIKSRKTLLSWKQGTGQFQLVPESCNIKADNKIHSFLGN